MNLLLAFGICVACGLAYSWLAGRRRGLSSIRPTHADLSRYRSEVVERWRRGDISYRDAEDMLDQADGRW